VSAPRNVPADPVLRRAALTSRWIGFASVACGGLVFYGRQARGWGPADQVQFIRVIAIGGFVIPGLLYLGLPIWLLRRKRWALFALVALALLTLLLMGLLLVMQLFNLPASAWLCAVCLTWVAAVAMLCAKLGRALTVMDAAGKPAGNTQKPAAPRR
jgi:hypothetical protein